jgi:hypothetical protein
MVTGLLLAAAMAVTLLAAWMGSRLAALALLLEAAVWLRIDVAFEGPHLVRVTKGHSLVFADLVGVAAVVGAGLAWRRLRRRR